MKTTKSIYAAFGQLIAAVRAEVERLEEDHYKQGKDIASDRLSDLRQLDSEINDLNYRYIHLFGSEE